MAKNKYYQVGSIMKPFTKTREGQEIPKKNRVMDLLFCQELALKNSPNN